MFSIIGYRYFYLTPMAKQMCPSYAFEHNNLQITLYFRAAVIENVKVLWEDCIY